ncbi:hypothetical protein PY365_06030 [Roseiarcaceae bacterium H3SJ34-1]|uniref:hypothetical protein n=1 Tax=Terripilifer ovatus TaxID=3032367 RepID=UPI003AB9B4C3|nr:hypothetical protein [Roseiarcaceae bacterium H3SJ34-1]
MHPSSGMVRAACAASCLVLTSFLPAQAGASGGFRGVAPALGGFHAAPRAAMSQPRMQRPASQNYGHPSFGQAGGRYAGNGIPNLGHTSFGHTTTANPALGRPSFGYPGRQPLGGPIYGHVRTGPELYPHGFAAWGYGQPRPGFRYDHHRTQRVVGAVGLGAYGYPYGGDAYPVSQAEPSVVMQYAEPPLQGYYGSYGGPAPCAAPIIIQINPGAGGAGRLLPPVVQGGGGSGCGVPQVVTYARADAPPQVIEGIGAAPRHKHRLRARY